MSQSKAAYRISRKKVDTASEVRQAIRDELQAKFAVMKSTAVCLAEGSVSRSMIGDSSLSHLYALQECVRLAIHEREGDEMFDAEDKAGLHADI